MCCGYPMRGNGMPIENSRIVTDNKVIFHRMANTLNYLDVKTILISCGTCMKQLKDYHLEEIFPGSRLVDIHEYLAENPVPVPRSVPQPDARELHGNHLQPAET